MDFRMGVSPEVLPTGSYVFLSSVDSLTGLKTEALITYLGYTRLLSSVDFMIGLGTSELAEALPDSLTFTGFLSRGESPDECKDLSYK